VLEAQIKVDLSSFLSSMSVYAVIKVNNDSRKSEVVKGTQVKFRQASFAFRTTSQDHLIDLQILS